MTIMMVLISTTLQRISHLAKTESFPTKTLGKTVIPTPILALFSL